MKVSTIRSLVDFPTRAGVTIVMRDYPGNDASLAVAVKESKIREITSEPIPGDNPK